jgi:hypothetical protein
MAQRDGLTEFVDLADKRGEVTETLTRRLYAPDGSIFDMPWGGNPLTYIKRGYKIERDPEWQKLNDDHESRKKDSLKLSNFQRDIKNRTIAVEAKALLSKEIADMERLEAQITALENGETMPTPTPEPEAVTMPAETPQPKAKRGRPAKV